MIFNFANGTAKQKALWEEAIGHLLNLPSEALPLTAAIEFVPSLSGANATSFAETEWSYGATSGSVRIRHDAPGFGDLDAGLIAEAASMGLHYNATTHFHETAAHETGHAVFAAIAHEYRLVIARLFGATSDDPSVLQPSGVAWQNRIGEGIAETFKEAFLPARYRVFPNRTTHKLSYAQYPTFRRIIREGLEAIEGGGGEFPPTTGGTPLPSYDLDVYKQYKVPESPLVQVFKEPPSEQIFEGGTFFRGVNDEGLYKPPGEEWEPPLEADDNTLYKLFVEESATETLLVPRGTHFAGSIDLPQDLDFYGPSEDLAVPGAGHFGEGGLAGVFTWEEIHNNVELNEPFGPFEQPVGGRSLGVVAVSIWFTYWRPSSGTWVCWDFRSGSITGFVPLFEFNNPHPNFPDDCWLVVKGDGRENVIDEGDTWSIPIGTISLASDVPSFAPTIETCGGDMVKARIFAKVRLKAGVSKQDSLAAIQSRLPSFRFTQEGVGCSGATFCYPYFSDQFPDESGNNWPAVHKGARDDEAFVTYSGISGFDGDWGVDMSQFAESSELPYSIEVEKGVVT